MRTATSAFRRLPRLLALAFGLALHGSLGLLAADLLGASAWIGFYAAWLPVLLSLVRARERGLPGSAVDDILREPVLGAGFGAAVALAAEASFLRALAVLAIALAVATVMWFAAMFPRTRDHAANARWSGAHARQLAAGLVSPDPNDAQGKSQEVTQ